MTDHDRDHGHEHDHGHGHEHEPAEVGVAVVTVSSTRTRDTDAAGDAVVAAVEASSDTVVARDVVGDDHGTVQRAVNDAIDDATTDCVVTVGGTGVTPDDITVEAIEPLLDKHLPGFGEVFRRRSETSVGTRVIATRATAGVADGTVVFALPGSEDAARTGAELVVAEAGHLVGLARRG